MRMTVTSEPLPPATTPFLLISSLVICVGVEAVGRRREREGRPTLDLGDVRVRLRRGQQQPVAHLGQDGHEVSDLHDHG